MKLQATPIKQIKKVFFLIIVICVFIETIQPALSQNGVLIAPTTGTAASDAMLEVRSTDKGILLPRMTTVERDAIPSPVTESLLIFNTTTKCFEAYVNGAWNTVSCPGGGCVPPSAPVANTASSIGCTSFTANWSTSAGATSYFLDVANDAGFTSFVSGYNNFNVGNVTSYNIAGLTNGATYYYRLRAANSCVSINSNTITVPITSLTAAGTITGTANPCQNQNGVAYFITAIPGATGYVWTYSGTGFTIASGSNTNSITANFSLTATSGTLTVYGTSACGNSGTSPNFSITVNTIPTLVTASASPTPICVGSTLSLTGSASGATSWSWSGPNSFTSTSQSPSLASITTAGAGIYSLTASNYCGSATVANTASVAVSAQPSASAGGNQTICVLGTATVSGASSSNGSIVWTENGSGSITAGQGTLTPTYTSLAGDAGNTVFLTMTVSNSPCTPATATYTVFVKANPTVAQAMSDICVINGGYTCTLAGTNPSVGTGTWFIVSGTPPTITSPSAYNSGVTNLGHYGTTILRWTISNAPCASSSATVNIVTVSGTHCQLLNPANPNNINTWTGHTNTNNTGQKYNYNNLMYGYSNLSFKQLLGLNEFAGSDSENTYGIQAINFIKYYADKIYPTEIPLPDTIKSYSERIEVSLLEFSTAYFRNSRNFIRSISD